MNRTPNKAVSIGLMTETLDTLRSTNPGSILNEILSEYEDPAEVAAAVTRHIVNPIVDPSPIKRTSVYMDTRRIDTLRDLAKHTYLPFDAILRILVQDYLQRHARP